MSEEPCGNALLPRGLRTCAFLEEKGMGDAAPGRRVAVSLLAPAMVPEQQCGREHPPLSLPMRLSQFPSQFYYLTESRGKRKLPNSTEIEAACDSLEGGKRFVICPLFPLAGLRKQR